MRDLALPRTGQGTEVWELHEDGKSAVKFPLTVRLGKPFDVLRMKGQSARQFRAWAAQNHKDIAALYAPGSARRRVVNCPCCTADTGSALSFAAIYGIEYRRCASCGHVFVGDQPAPDVLNRMFTEQDAYAQEYTAQDQIEQRMREIIAPKLDWVRDVYRQHHGRELTSVLDVGAGGGHFVAGCRRAGLKADGYEISKAARAFAQAALNVELRAEDFLHEQGTTGEFDAVTFWGLLEYTPEPAQFLAAARRRLVTKSGMLIVEVPRADALGSAIQATPEAQVWRHLSPESHVNIYSDASIATLLHDHGFRPFAAWYFGMDFYELLCQFAAALDDDRLLTQMGHLITPMQAWLDAAELADDLLLAAVPV